VSGSSTHTYPSTQHGKETERGGKGKGGKRGEESEEREGARLDINEEVSNFLFGCMRQCRLDIDDEIAHILVYVAVYPESRIVDSICASIDMPSDEHPVASVAHVDDDGIALADE